MFTQNCILLHFLEAKNPYFVTKNCFKSSYICVFILSKKRRNWFHKNLHNLGIVGRRKLSDPSLNRIFNALSIGVQYTLSFRWTNFGLKCLFAIENKKTLYVLIIAMICPNLASLWQFQYFQRPIYNRVKHLWWNFYRKNSEPLSIFTQKLHHRCLHGF